jgi:hypothetical protein
MGKDTYCTCVSGQAHAAKRERERTEEFDKWLIHLREEAKRRRCHFRNTTSDGA